MATKNFSQNFNKLVEIVMQQNPETRIEFSLQENKKNGKRYFNMRQFVKNESYDGPTKNGFSFVIDEIEEMDDFQEAFNKFFAAVKDKV
jgi:hypothetical protein